MLDRIPRLARVKKEPKAQTGAQTVGSSTNAVDLVHLLSGGGTNACGMNLWGTAPPASIRTWRTMCNNPTIALGLATAKAPIKAAQWGVETDDGTAEERADLIRDWVLPLRPTLLCDGLLAVEYGRQPFETVWAVEEGKMVPAKLKPLLPEKTEILTDPKTGAFIGLKNGDVTLDPNDSLVIHFDGEAGSMLGKSRLENIREDAWHPWKQTLVRLSQYTTKAAGIVPILRYPVGESQGPNGETVSNSDIATGILRRIGQGGSIAMPNQIPGWLEQALQRGLSTGNFADLMAWQLEFVEAANLHGEELVSLLTKFESLMVRGLLCPERSILEGQNGTKAEAGVHGDIGTSIAEDDSEQLMRIINWHLVDKVLEANYGPEARGTVRVCAAPLVDEQADLLRAILTEVLKNPANIDLLIGMLDLEASMEQLGLPVKKEAIYPEPGDLGKDGHESGPDGKPLDNPNAVVASIFKAARVLRSA